MYNDFISCRKTTSFFTSDKKCYEKFVWEYGKDIYNYTFSQIITNATNMALYNSLLINNKLFKS